MVPRTELLLTLSSAEEGTGHLFLSSFCLPYSSGPHIFTLVLRVSLWLTEIWKEQQTSLTAE